MHLDAETTQRVLHGELAASASAEAVAHLAGCASCRADVARARADEEEIFALLGTIDHPRPPADVRRIHERARRRHWTLPQRWAAGFLMAAGLAGVAYAVPSSPLRRWIEGLRHPSAVSIVPQAMPQTIPQAPAAADLAGVSIAPGPSALVVFLATQSAGEARVALADIPDIEVRGPAGAARFAAGEGRLTIDNTGAAMNYDIRIPRAAARVEIQVAGVRVWLKDGGRVLSEYTPSAMGLTKIPLTR